MATIATNTSGLTDNRYAQYYSKKLLKHAIQALKLAEVCEKFSLPMHAGTTTLRMFKRSKAAASSVETIAEGTVSSTYSNSTLTPVDVPLVEYGEKARITNVRQETDLLKQLDIEVERMGEACALKVDTVVRDEAIGRLCTAALTTTFSVFAGSSGTSALGATAIESAWDAWKGGAVADTKLTLKDIEKAITRLKVVRGPKFSGDVYLAVLTPEQIFDLRQDGRIVAVQSYQDKEKVYSGEIGKIAGVRILEATNPFRIAHTEAHLTDATPANTIAKYSASGAVYAGMVFARQGIGTVDLAGAKSAMKPKFTYLNGPDKSDPHNQFRVAAWNGYFAAKVLDDEWVVPIWSKSTYNE